MMKKSKNRKIKVSEYKRLVKALERKVRVELPACKSYEEQCSWLAGARRIGFELDSSVCERAKSELLNRAEKALSDYTLATFKILEI